jgi:hypothetical protein
MRRTTLMASLVAMATAAAADDTLPVSVPAPAEAQSPAEPAQEKATSPDPAPPETPSAPPAPVVVPVPAPARVTNPAPPPPVPVPVPVPVPAFVPPTEFAAPGPGEYAPVLRVQPAHRIAMMEAGRELPETDPLVARAAGDLSQLTARYLEDAPRIADLAIRTTAAIRAANRPASPLEMMEAALNSRRPAGIKGVGPRLFQSFAELYRKVRVEQGQDHAGAIDAIQGGAGPAAKPR